MAIHSDSNDQDVKLVQALFKLTVISRVVPFHNRYIVYYRVHMSRLRDGVGGVKQIYTSLHFVASPPIILLVINYRQNNKDKLNMGTRNVFVTDDTSPVSITEHQDLSINFTGLPDGEGGVLGVSSRVSLSWLGSWASPVLGDIFHSFSSFTISIQLVLTPPPF